MVIIIFLLGLYYVDQPYLDVPGHGEYKIQLRFGPDGGILGFFHVGVMDRFSFGVSYGASNLIGSGDPEFYEIPGVQVKIMAIQGYAAPQLILGFDNQGFGAYNGARYAVMSKGLYAQLGKTLILSRVEIIPSLGCNFCFEGENRFDMFMGMTIQFSSNSGIIMDYSANFDDNIDQNKGYFNVGLKFMFYDELSFEFGLRDLLDNGPSGADQQLNIMIRLGYEQSF
jgi:hypothetical protein